VDEVLLAKAGIIERCLLRICEEYNAELFLIWAKEEDWK